MSEITEITAIFVGTGMLIVSSVAAWMLYQLSRFVKSFADKEGRFDLFEELVLDKFAQEKVIDLEKKALEREIIRKKGFRKRLEEEMINNLLDAQQNKKSEKEK